MELQTFGSCSDAVQASGSVFKLQVKQGNKGWAMAAIVFWINSIFSWIVCLMIRTVCPFSSDISRWLQVHVPPTARQGGPLNPWKPFRQMEGKNSHTLRRDAAQNMLWGAVGGGDISGRWSFWRGPSLRVAPGVLGLFRQHLGTLFGWISFKPGSLAFWELPWITSQLLMHFLLRPVRVGLWLDTKGAGRRRPLSRVT